MPVHYPANPSAVPANLTTPTKHYQRNAWLAMGALILFVCLYIALSGWFGWKSYKLTTMAFSGSKDAFWIFALGVCAGFLAIFMLKALFFVNKGGEPEDLEITAKDQPELFSFLGQLAKDTGAPKPHRVFLSPRVNAAVFYDLSILNLFFPSKKNLEIGLPLVNVLTISEFKAVLAHEFGHFAQRSMAVGRWVYMAQQIAGYLISKRDGLDRFLSGLSRSDFRIAWVGWILSLIIWSIRSLAESAFHLVVIAQRALSREMELQADLVAVSVTGSEALINALHRTGAADAAWDRAILFANEEIAKGHATQDLLAIQTRIIEKLRLVLADPYYGNKPAPAQGKPEEQRLFKPEIAQPSRMWATHPYNHEREENAKRVFVQSTLDDTPSWVIFNSPELLRQQLSAHMIRNLKEPVPMRDMNESMASIDSEYERESYAARYRGLYLSRPLASYWQNAAAMYSAPLPSELTEFKSLYPEDLSAQLKRLNDLERDKTLLEAIRDGKAKPAGGMIRHHGKELQKKQLPQAIAHIEIDITNVNQQLLKHDQLCRSLHRSMAQTVGNGWEAHLAGVTETLHYAEHTEANIRDLVGLLGNTVAVVTAAGPTNKKGATRIIADAGLLYSSLAAVSSERSSVQLTDELNLQLRKGSWDQTLGEFTLPAPGMENINDWIKAIDSWTSKMRSDLLELRSVALEQLLKTEALLFKAWQKDPQAHIQLANLASQPCKVPDNYPKLLPGQERKRQTKLPWLARIQTANGLAPAAARMGIAGAILAGVLGIGGTAVTAQLTIYNGLAQTVIVKIDQESVTLAPRMHSTLSLDSEKNYAIRAQTSSGEIIEEFPVQIDTDLSNKVYNIAAAAPLVEWTAIYGSAVAQPDRQLGAKRWINTSANIIFEEPPKSVSSKSGNTRIVLSELPANLSVGQILDTLEDQKEKDQLILAHARWDDTKSLNTMDWLYVARGMPGLNAIIESRLKTNPKDVLVLRVQQDNAKVSERLSLCQHYQSLAQSAPKEPDLEYLVTRCIDDSKIRDQAFIAGHKASPQSVWYAYAAGYTYAGLMQWAESQASLQQAVSKYPALADHVNADLARIRRIQSTGSEVTLNDLSSRSDSLKQYLAFEADNVVPANSPARAYVLLREGKLSEVLSAAKSAPAMQARLMRVLAVSSGASAEMVSQALALPADKGVDQNTVWFAIALAIREKRSIAAYDVYSKYLSDQSTLTMQKYIELLQTNAAPSMAEAALQGIDPALRGQAYCMGIIVWGDKAPTAWKSAVKKLLFPTERPYFS
jgi:Zn-dependent protease with chaperone function